MSLSLCLVCGINNDIQNNRGHAMNWLYIFIIGFFAIGMQAADLTVTFQQGLNGYSGVSDTWVSTNSWDTPPQHTVNYGQNESITLMRDGDQNPLLKFDLSSIPANSKIVSAHLELYNITPSSSGAQVFDRRIRLFRILRDWDEGNQINSPIDASGKHGATGDHAFDYFPGSGVDVPWGERGMQANTDYDGTETGHTDVQDEGWYSWDVTELVRNWVRLEQPNFGFVLRDATGYQDGHTDWREFRSSQFPDSQFRPRLIVTYNPDVPFASAGPDQEILDWAGSSIQLDGSASTDRPGGNNATLQYQWEVIQSGYGSSLSGIVGQDQMPSVTPDTAGEWIFQLTVTNDLGEFATDTVNVRLLSINASHPRIYLSPQKLAQLQARAVTGNPRWDQLVLEAQAADAHMHTKALVGLLTNSDSLQDSAVQDAIDLMNQAGDYPTKTGDIALVYDWCYSRLSTQQIQNFVSYFNSWAQDNLDNPYSSDVPGWGNYWPRFSYSFLLAGLASFGDNPRAQEWMDEYRKNRFQAFDIDILNRIAEGGAWPEGMIYDWIANLSLVRAIQAWLSATGENLFLSSSWFKERLPFLLIHRWPGLASEWGYEYHPYASIGDSERNRGAIGNYERIMNLILLEQFPDEPLSRQLHAYMASGTTANSDTFLYHDEFMWFDPDLVPEQPQLKTHYARGTGTVIMRSGWPDGAEDTDPSATHIMFQCGDHFTYHQHYDQNSFTLFKYNDLALDSGVYSGDGLSYHDRDYYVRTIAHNTLIVRNPTEDFSDSRPEATTNDGGQRSVYPATRSPQTVEYFDLHQTHYETGNITRFEDHEAFTYALGDATHAYNNPTYNQAMDTDLSGNTAKVSRFLRSFCYLREVSGYPGSGDYVVMLDRVGVVHAAYSGENTKLLFHTFNEPQVNGTPQTVSAGETLYTQASQVTSANDPGKLFINFIHPEQVHIRKVGGRGEKAFWVFDQNVDWHWDASEPQPRPISDFESEPYGEWRIELEPVDTNLDHSFLTVMTPRSTGTVSPPAMNLISGNGLLGVHIEDSGLNRVCVFSADDEGAPLAGTLTYQFVPSAESHHAIFDLEPLSAYEVNISTPDGATQIELVPQPGGAWVASDQGVIQFYTSDVDLCETQFNALASTWPQVTVLELITEICQEEAHSL
ncbi:MAG: hypothetical protein CR997_11560 [Acidobacteria bacterium]|nr:MAG: hypothetical protein CR997_11560 [Acidobacteriota bacterium]